MFTQTSQLLLVSGASSRPQLPFLHSDIAYRHPLGPNRPSLQLQLSRLLTTDRKIYLKDQIWKGAKYTVYGWASLILLSLMAYGLQTEIAERKFPTPPEWKRATKTRYHVAQNEENPGPDGTGIVDWSKVGKAYQDLIERLEDPAIDGQGIQPLLQEDGDIYVAGVGKSGLDVSSMSEAWRRGYYACLMGAAKACENREGWVRDTTTNVVFPREVVIGPSNPQPKPVPYGAKPPPQEENCVPVFEPAEKYYMKILTTHGFTSRQRLDAALAFADWLDFKGLPSTAEEMYDWGLDIAMGALPVGVNNVVDIKTGVINSSATYVSSNILKATTALAIHHARNDNLAAALPIFISVLRARRQLPLPDSSSMRQPTPKEKSSLSIAFSLLKSLLVTPPYPPIPPTGDEMSPRTQGAMCEEAGIMSHIGEILFASTSATGSTPKTSSTPAPISPISLKSTQDQLANQQAGLSWTREAVDLAEATLISLEKTHDTASRDKCSECLSAGMDNWSTMVTGMLKEERKRFKFESPSQPKTGSWFWGNNAEVEGATARWEQESRLVEERFSRVRRLLGREADRKISSSGGSFFM